MAKAPPKKQSKSDFVDQIAKLSKGAKIGVFVGSLVLVGAAFYMLAYVPYTEQQASLHSQISSAQSNISTQQATLKKHEAVNKEAAAIEASYEYMQKFLPVETEMPRLVLMVSEIASKAGLADGVTLFAPKLPAVVRDNYAEIPFSMNLKGEFLTVLTFLYDFSRMDRIVNITQVDIGTPVMVDARREIFHISVKCAGSTYRTLTEAELLAKSAPPAKKR
ncbi:MAG: type 4a pilus biogenesis protein PilO [Candidatus Adiutrix sp.]|nr:type 4a pilus biogenesis protein PilO [Candidatus Adiutrix sp.]